MVPAAVRDIFALIEGTPERQFVLRLSMLEIYNEVRMLIGAKSPRPNPHTVAGHKPVATPCTVVTCGITCYRVQPTCCHLAHRTRKLQHGWRFRPFALYSPH